MNTDVTVVSMHQLSNMDACAKRRNFPQQEMLVSGDKPDFAIRSGVICKAALTAGQELLEVYAPVSTEEERAEQEEKTESVLSDARASITEGFEELDYKSEKQLSALVDASFEWVKRFAVCYGQTPHSKKGMITCDTRDIQIPSGPLVKNVRLDGIDVYASPVNEDGKPVAEYMLTGFKLKASKPKITQETALSSLELYAYLLYLRSKVNPGHTAYLKASVQYLRKENDRYGENPYFDPDFYNTVGGRNIINLEEVYHAPAADEEPVKTDLDIVFERVVKQYVEGIPEEECTKEDCEFCELHDICKYTESPLAQEKTPTIKALSGLRLTPSQKDIINFRKGNLRVIAGPGSGKTMTVSVRTVSLLNEGVDPASIMLVTFTDAAAKEMRERVASYNEDLAGVDLEELKIFTFNSFGDYLIGLRFEDLGFSRKPAVIDDTERATIIRDLMCQHGEIEGLDYFNFEMDEKNCKGALSVVSKVFEIIKQGENGVSYGVGDEKAIYEKFGADKRFLKVRTEPERLAIIKQIAKLYDLYDEKLREECLIEYADQETMPFELIRNDPMFLSSLGVKHLIVDEYQDSNTNNSMMCKALLHSKGMESTMFVGDISQSIYAFRGGLPENLASLEEKLDCKITDIPLMENFRSDANVCDFANEFIKRNRNGDMYKIVPTREATYPVTVTPFHYKQDEIDFVVDKIKKHLSGELEPKARPEDIAVLCATKAELQDMEAALAKEGIESVTLAPEPLQENSRVKAAIALMKAINNPDDGRDLLIYANARMFGRLPMADSDEVEALLAEIREELDAVRTLKGDDKKEMVLELMRLIDENEDEVYESFIERLERKRDVRQMKDYVESFLQFGKKVSYRRLSDFSGVVLTTAHSSKGLEWPVVFNMISKYDESETTHSHLAVVEEKRRLMYVSSTRAKDRLYITGRYVAFGKRGDYRYNKYLIEAMGIVGQVFNQATVEEQKQLLDLERKNAKKAEKDAKEKTPEEKALEKIAELKKKAKKPFGKSKEEKRAS